MIDKIELKDLNYSLNIVKWKHIFQNKKQEHVRESGYKKSINRRPLRQQFGFSSFALHICMKSKTVIFPSNSRYSCNIIYYQHLQTAATEQGHLLFTAHLFFYTFILLICLHKHIIF